MKMLQLIQCPPYLPVYENNNNDNNDNKNNDNDGHVIECNSIKNFKMNDYINHY